MKQALKRRLCATGRMLVALMMLLTVQTTRAFVPQTPSADLVSSAKDYQMKASKYIWGELDTESYRLSVSIIWDNDDVWIKGLCPEIADGWIKGTYNTETKKVTFLANQYIGSYEIDEDNVFDYYISSGDDGESDLVMDYDEETDKLTLPSSDSIMVYMVYSEEPSECYTYADVSFLYVPDVAAIPAQPVINDFNTNGTDPLVEMTIKQEDKDGNPILSNKLSYQLLYEVNHVADTLTLTTELYECLVEDTKEIPYGFFDDEDFLIGIDAIQLKMNTSTWNRIGIQSIYRGGGEERTSEIFWYTINPYICDVALANNTKEATNWKAAIGDGELQALPLADVASSDTIAISYSGLLKVKGVTAQFSVGDKTENAKIVAGTAANTWTMTEFLDDVTLNVEYYPVATMTVAPKAPAAVYASEDMALVSNGETNDGTIMYALSQSNTEVPTTFTTTVPNAKSFTTQNTYYVWYYIVGDNTHNDSEPQYVTVKLSDPLPVINSPYIYDDDDPVIVAHKLALLTILNKAQSINLGGMSAVSIQNLKDAIAYAEEALKNKDVTADELDTAREALIKAIDELQPKSDDENEDLLQPTNNEQEPKSTDNEAQPKSTNSEAEVVTTIGRVASDSTTDYYDLQGRKVKNPKKGIYIYKGKKVKR
jgi:hypothetical protein